MLIYKKESDHNRPHKFPQFIASLKKISEVLHGKKVQKVLGRFKELVELTKPKSVKPPSEKAIDKAEGEGEGEGHDSANESEVQSKQTKNAKQSKQPTDKNANKDDKIKQNKKVLFFILGVF